MARGLGGDDGPTLFMFVAVVLIWGTVQKWISKAGDKVNAAGDTISSGLELGKNSASILQPQTTADITQSEETVKSWVVEWSKCPKLKPYYQTIADKLWREMTSTFNIDEEAIISTCVVLNKFELIAVAKCFGVKEASAFGLTTWSGHIFQAFDVAFDGTFKDRDRATLHQIWAKTRLW